MEGKNFRLLSINVNGLDKEKVNKLTKIDDFDLLFLQETHNKVGNDLIEQIEREMDCIFLTNNDTDTRAGGVATLIKNKRGINWERFDEGPDFKGRMIHLAIGGDHFINIYAPVLYRERYDFLDKLAKYLERVSPHNLVLGGDFNWVGADIDRTGGQTRWDMAFNSKMEGITKIHNMIDIYRRFNMPRREFTFHYRDKGSRIDTFFGTKLGTNIYTMAGISQLKISDHNLIYVELKRKVRTKWGRGQWKINNKILDYKEFEGDIKREINDFKSRGNLDIISEWDKLKGIFKKIAIYHSKMRVKNLKLKKEALGNLLKTNIEQDIKNTIELKLDNIKKELGKGKEIKAGKFTNLYKNAEGL